MEKKIPIRFSDTCYTKFKSVPDKVPVLVLIIENEPERDIRAEFVNPRAWWISEKWEEQQAEKEVRTEEFGEEPERPKEPRALKL